MASSSSIFSPSTSGGSQQNQMNSEKINLPCKFYPACRFGNNCRYLHIEGMFAFLFIFFIFLFCVLYRDDLLFILFEIVLFFKFTSTFHHITSLVIFYLFNFLFTHQKNTIILQTTKQHC
jgi:hypothetical protein